MEKAGSVARTKTTTPSKTTSRAPKVSPRPKARPTPAQTQPFQPTFKASPSLASGDFKPSDSGSALAASLGQTFSAPPAATTNSKIAEAAEGMVGKQFKPTEDARCADFVSHAIDKSGTNPDGFSPTVRARDFGKMGAEKIDFKDLKAGDIVAFNDTYRKSPDKDHHTHVGIYAGNGEFIHRPTKAAGYVEGSKPGEVIKEKISDYLARDRGNLNASFAGGYRFP